MKYKSLLFLAHKNKQISGGKGLTQVVDKFLFLAILANFPANFQEQYNVPSFYS